MASQAHQAKRYAQECAASLRSMEHVDLREAAYIAACEIDVLHFEALQRIKEAIDEKELLAQVVWETHVGSAHAREYIDVAQSKIAVTDLMAWAKDVARGCTCGATE